MLLLRQSRASETRTLIKETTVLRRPQIGALAKDRSTSPKFTWARFTGPYQVKFPAVRLHMIEDVSVLDTLAVQQGMPILDHHITPVVTDQDPGKPPQWWLETAVEMLRPDVRSVTADDTPTLVLHNEGGGTWGHWIVQNLPKALLFKMYFPDGKLALPHDYLGETNNFGLSLELFGISRDAIVPIGRHVAVMIPRAVFIDHLYHDQAVHPVALDLLSSSNMAATAKVSVGGRARRRLFIDRTTKQTSRNITNITEIAREAGAFGFDQCNLGADPVAGQAAAWRHGSHFMSILGSDFTNIVFSQGDADVLSITPDFHGDMFFFDLAAAKGLRWHELLCGNLVEERARKNRSSFSIDPEVFRSFLSAAIDMA